MWWLRARVPVPHVFMSTALAYVSRFLCASFPHEPMQINLQIARQRLSATARGDEL